MPDNFNSAYLAVRAERNKAASDKLLAELDAKIAAQEAKPATAAPLAPQQPTPPAQQPPAKDAPGFVSEASRAILGGVRDAGQNALNLIDEAATWLDNNILDLRMGSSTFGTVGGTKAAAEGHKEGQFIQLPEVDKNQTTAGQMARGVTQFVVPFIGSLKALKAAQLLQGAGTATAMARSAAAGAATDFAAFDPHEKRLANLLVEAGDNIPGLKNPVTEYLAASPGDSSAEGRFKNTLEGLGLGLAAEAVFHGVRAAKGHFSNRGTSPAEAIGGAAQAAKADAEQAAVESLKSKGIMGRFRTPAKPPKDASPQAPKVAPEVASVEPLPATAKPLPVIDDVDVSRMLDAAKDGNFENLAQVVKQSDFNFSRLDTEEDVKQAMDAFSSVFEKAHKEATGGVQSLVQTAELAKEVGTTPETLEALYQGTGNLAAKVTAHRAFLVASAEKVSSYAKMLTGKTPLPEGTDPASLVLAMRKQVALHATIQAQVKGVQTEVARTLSSFRIQAKSADLARIERDTLIDAMGGFDANKRFAQQLADITDPAALNNVIRRSAGARTADALFEAWVNGLLSSPVTHAVNAVGNGLVAIGSLAERGGASLIGKVLRNPEGIETGEVKAMAWGMAEGLMDAIRITSKGLDAIKEAGGAAVQGNMSAAGAAIKGNAGEFGTAYRAFATDSAILDSTAHATRPLDMQMPAITADRFGINPRGFIGKAADGMGTLLRIPGRLLTTSDELFKTIHYRGELRAQAYRMARQEGLEGDALLKRIVELLEEPPPELREQALTVAREGTFTAPLGDTGQAIQRAIQATPGTRWLMPFVRTPINIMKYVGERTPGLNLLAESVRTELAAGGARRDVMLAKTSTGAALYAVGSYLAAQGIIIGGGEKDQTAEKLGGQLPYSIKIGDTYYAFNRLDPVGMFLGLAADMSDLSGHLHRDTMDDLAGASLLAITRNLISKSYLSGLVKLLDAIDEGRRGNEKAFTSYIGNMAATFVPFSSLQGAVAREIDPTAREVWGLMDSIKARVPGFTKDLPPLRNVFGEEVKLTGGMGPDIMSPLRTSEATTDPLAAEVARLNIDLRRPEKTLFVTPGAPAIDLTPQQYDKLSKSAGEMFKRELGKLINSERYKALPEDPSNTLYMEGKEKVIRDLHSQVKHAATMRLLAEDEELKAQFRTVRSNAANVLKGAPLLPL